MLLQAGAAHNSMGSEWIKSIEKQIEACALCCMYEAYNRKKRTLSCNKKKRVASNRKETESKID